MADNIVGGLFGIDPQQLMQQRQATDMSNAFRYAQLDPLEQAKMSIYQGGAGLARGVQGLLGGDPELERISKIKQLSSQFDLTTSQGARDFARALQPFAPNEAMMASREADRMEQSGLTRQKTQADIGVTQRKEAQLEQMRTELAALPLTATNADKISVLSKYGDPDTMFKALVASEDRQAALEQRRATADLARATREDTRNQKQMLLDEKRQEKLDKQTAAADAAISSADRLIAEVKDTKKMVSGFTAGAGSLLSNVPLTESKDLSKRLTTIKANLGFDRLQQMRDASPTGGALGQVAVQELVALQSTIASLDQDQSPKQLKDGLDKIELHYTNWRNAVKKAGKASPTAGAEGGTGQQGTAANPIVLK